MPPVGAVPPVGTVSPAEQDIAIPNWDDPDPVLVDLLTNAKRGDLLNVQTTLKKSVPVLVTATAYKMRAGEDEPNVYAFSKRTTSRYLGTDAAAIEVTKFLKPTVLILAVTRDKSGKITPNADMTHVVEALQDTDSVEVQFTKFDKPGVGLLKSIKIYVPFQRCSSRRSPKRNTRATTTPPWTSLPTAKRFSSSWIPRTSRPSPPSS